MPDWIIDRIVHFDFGRDIVKSGLAHFGFVRLNLPKISSMDYHENGLFVPTDLTADSGDLVVLRRLAGSAAGVR